MYVGHDGLKLPLVQQIVDEFISLRENPIEHETSRCSLHHLPPRRPPLRGCAPPLPLSLSPSLPFETDQNIAVKS